MKINFGYKANIRTRPVTEQLQRGIQANLKAAAMIWWSGVQKELTGMKSGRTYFVPGTGGVTKKPITIQTKHPRYKVKSYKRRAKIRTGVTYRASSPGESPARRTGTLAQTYQYRVRNGYAEVGSPEKYAIALEKGTSRMAPRPHLAKAYVKNRKQIENALGREVI